MPIYEAVCKECGTVAARSKNIPEKDYYKLYFMAQQKNCPNCNRGIKGSKEQPDFPFDVRPAKNQGKYELPPGVRRLAV